MDKTIAKQILNQSIGNLKQRREKIALTDLEAEVINLACLSIFKKQKEMNYSSQIFPHEFKEAAIEAFTEAAMGLFPQAYTFSHAAIARMGIQRNIYSEGMWEFLRRYFEENHGIKIDDIEISANMFSNSLNSNSIPLNNLPKYPAGDFDSFKTFIKKWNSSMSTKEKMSTAVHSDNYVNQGVDTYEKGDILGAIRFYEQALEIMPNNDDALKNLRICYSKIGRHDKASDMDEKLNYLEF